MDTASHAWPPPCISLPGIAFFKPCLWLQLFDTQSSHGLVHAMCVLYVSVAALFEKARKGRWHWCEPQQNWLGRTILCSIWWLLGMSCCWWSYWHDLAKHGYVLVRLLWSFCSIQLVYLLLCRMHVVPKATWESGHICRSHRPAVPAAMSTSTWMRAYAQMAYFLLRLQNDFILSHRQLGQCCELGVV